MSDGDRVLRRLLNSMSDQNSYVDDNRLSRIDIPEFNPKLHPIVVADKVIDRDGNLSPLCKKFLKDIKSSFDVKGTARLLMQEQGSVAYCEFLRKLIDDKSISQKQAAKALISIYSKETGWEQGIYLILSQDGNNQKIVNALCDLLDRFDDESLIEFLVVPLHHESSSTILDRLLQGGSMSKARRYVSLMQYVKDRLSISVVEGIVDNFSDKLGFQLASFLSCGNSFAVHLLVNMYRDLNISTSNIHKAFANRYGLKEAVRQGHSDSVIAYCRALQPFIGKFNLEQKKSILTVMRDAELMPGFLGFGTKKTKEYISLCKKDSELHSVYKATKELLKD